ncbi:uncharacterized protein DSM5745_07689 [Aspergillus mulundensis]|uniref:Non-reducing end beta-L-arabinofuranosidase-like GH127 catalytic domain-containing protein n=1 Tax=Aspergillus mulundensis TaxID=1810919 RepID=A0A3D8REP4_9EURO|nr:Uncharacterized protein DSM5745_07689 [Aspergillus mulundensis]RDW72517.1 Uncharacterized protein DSM5745_07689 [Aspergillus mulundensis]
MAEPKLASFKYDPFPLGSIQASGWLKDQLVLAADALPGHLFDFYRYVADSTWLGGSYEYSELNEAAPYWFNYIVPLAYTLDDARLKMQAKAFLDYTLEHQAEDGWLGPEETRQTRGIWARSLLFFALIQYAEADPSETDRIVTAMHRFTALAHTMLQNNFTGLLQDEQEGDNFDPYRFGVSRTHELPLALQWLYENHPRGQEGIIWETMELMFTGGKRGGRDWTTFFVEGVFPTVGTPDIKTSGFTHGVNLAQGLRYPTVLYRMTGDAAVRGQTDNAVRWTEQYQSTRAGSITGDEHLGGTSPQRGSETCMAVEMMYSMAYLYRMYGVNEYADMVERPAFNALPAAISPEWWAHQYVQQTNQPWSKNLTDNPFFNVVSYGSSFGLEPNFPCCTVNHAQGYPKYTANSYVRQGPSHIVHALLGPTTLNTRVRDENVRITCETNYPFDGQFRYTITTETSLDFSVRIPAWTLSSNPNGSPRSKYRVGKGEWRTLSPTPDSLQSFRIPSGTNRITIKVNLHMEPRVTEPRNGTDSVAIYYGPLLYALDLEYANPSSHSPLNWTDRTPLPVTQVLSQTRDWVLDATSEWRYAIDPDSVTVERLHEVGRALLNPVWAREATPVALWVDAWVIDWQEELGTAALPPVNPVVSGEPTRVRLIPYGAAKLHIAEFPVASRQE